MADTVKVILEISDGIRDFLERKQIDLYAEIREEIPSSKLEILSDPAAPAGSKDLVPAIVVATSLISALSPLIIRTFNQFKPDTTEVKIEETETHNPDGSVTIHRIKISEHLEYNHQAHLHHEGSELIEVLEVLGILHEEHLGEEHPKEDTHKTDS